MAARSTFPPGLELEARKAATMRQPLRAAPAPPCVVVALDQGSGDAAQPLLTTGARVRIGTPIGRAAGEAAVDVHSPVAGVVLGVETRPIAGPAGEGACIVIENDGSDDLEPGLASIDWPNVAPEELLRADPQCRHSGPGRCRVPGPCEARRRARTLCGSSRAERRGM